MYEHPENFHFHKEVGMIPAMVQRHPDWETAILAFKHPALTRDKGEDYGVRVEYISSRPYRKKPTQVLQVILYILRHARTIDVLEFIHLERRKALFALAFKLRNPRGKVFLKLDSDTERIGHQLPLHSSRIVRDLVLWPKRSLLRRADIIGVETTRMRSLLCASWSHLKAKIHYLPSGVLPEMYPLCTGNVPLAKKNVILTVGRIGSEQKNNEALLRAFIALRRSDWSLRFVGPCTEAFKRTVDRAKEAHPELRDTVEIVGPIWDRHTLLQEYRDASIFCLTSTYGSFELVLVEAAAMQCSIVTYDVGVARDLVTNEEWGAVIPVGDETSLVRALASETQRWDAAPRDLSALRDHALTRFNWATVGEKLLSLINQSDANSTGRRSA